MSYVECLEALSDDAEEAVDRLEDHASHRFIERLCSEAAQHLESRMFDRAYVAFTVSLGLMYRWEASEALDTRPDILERALERTFSTFRFAQAGYAMADLMIARRYGCDVSRDEITRHIGMLSGEQRDRALSWIALTARKL